MISKLKRVFLASMTFFVIQQPVVAFESKDLLVLATVPQLATNIASVSYQYKNIGSKSPETKIMIAQLKVLDSMASLFNLGVFSFGKHYLDSPMWVGFDLLCIQKYLKKIKKYESQLLREQEDEASVEVEKNVDLVLTEEELESLVLDSNLHDLDELDIVSSHMIEKISLLFQVIAGFVEFGGSSMRYSQDKRGRFIGLFYSSYAKSIRHFLSAKSGSKERLFSGLFFFITIVSHYILNEILYGSNQGSFRFNQGAYRSNQGAYRSNQGAQRPLKPLDLYKLFNIPYDTSVPRLMRKRLSKRFHPDKQEGSSEVFKELIEAVNLLEDDVSRRDYNRDLNPVSFLGGLSHRNSYQFANLKEALERKNRKREREGQRNVSLRFLKK